MRFDRLKNSLLSRVTLPMADASQVEGRLRAILRHDGRRGVSRRGAAAAIVTMMVVVVPVALLRSMPASARPGLISLPSPSLFDVAAKPVLLYDTLPANAPWTRRVSKSVSVEFVGMTEGLSKTAASWRPDGTRLTQPLYRRHDPQMTPQYPNRDRVCEFAFRLTHPTGLAVETSYQIPASSSFNYGSGPAYNNGVQVADEHELNSNTAGFRVVSAVLPKSLTHVTVRIGVAAGPWQFRHQTGPGENSSSGIVERNGTEDEVLIQFIGEHMLTVTDTFLKEDHRIIAIGKDGRVYDLHDRDVHNGQRFRVTTVRLDMPLSQIEEFRFQTRPYQWVEFKGVTLNPPIPIGAASLSKNLRYNFTWGNVPGHPENAVAQMKRFYQWITIYRNAHSGAYPVGPVLLDTDMRNHPQEYGFPAEAMRDNEITLAFTNPDVRYSNLRTMSHPVIPYVMMQPYRLDGTALGSAKAPGTRDVLAYTDIYVHQNWRNGIPTTRTGFYPVLWDDGTVTLVPWNKILRVPYVPSDRLQLEPVTAAVSDDAIRNHRSVPWTYVFPGQAGVPVNALTVDQYEHRQ